MTNQKKFYFSNKKFLIKSDSLSPKLFNIIKNHLNEYKPYTGKSIDFIINIEKTELVKEKIISNNPRTHFETNTGFKFVLPKIGDITWKKQKNHMEVTLTLYPYRYKKNYLYKLFNPEFKQPYEHLGQILHENILVPAILFFTKDLIIIHGSAITNNNQGIIFSGTGGVGKTFLEMYFITKNKYNFLCDDMSPTDGNFIYANNAPPKIYHYNILQQPQLNDLITKNYPYLNLLHWKLYPKLPKLGTMSRRTIQPNKLSLLNKKTNLSQIYLLFKDNSINAPKKELISSKTISENMYNIISIEYANYFNHIKYHELNCKLMHKKPLTKLQNIKKKYLKILTKNANINSYLLRIPTKDNIGNWDKVITKLILNN
jgi:hypothetical protein